jgi:cytochrome c553
MNQRSPVVHTHTHAAVLAFACLALIASVCFAAAPAHAAQPPKVPDTIAQRTAACTTCHGKEGRATNEGYFPRIAGKPAGYLYNQLVNFRDGRRTYALMTYLVEHLTNPYLYEMAQYFADLDLPYPPPQTSSASPQLLSRGEALVRRGDAGRNIPACAQCHGEKLTGVNPAIPGLLGLSRDYLQAQLGHWKSGERRAQAPDCMAKISAQLTPEEVGAVTSWLAAQAVPADSKPASSLPAKLPLDCGGIPK